jgi:endonuclease YncB( thermonuclease family)
LDRYKRYLCKINLNDTDINLEQIKRGLAWHYKQYQNDQSKIDKDTYSRAEETAKLNRTGLWIDKQPTPPWEWRRQ